MVSTGYEIASTASLPRNEREGWIWSQAKTFYESMPIECPIFGGLFGWPPENNPGSG